MNYPQGWYTGTVKLSDIPENEIYVRLHEDFRSKILQSLKNKSPRENLNSLAETLGLKLDNLTPFALRGAKIRLSLLLKLAAFVNMDRKILENSIIELAAQRNSKGILDPKFPFNFNTEQGSRFLSAIFHDGGIMKWSLQPYYVNVDEDLKTHFIRCAESVYGRVDSGGLNVKNMQVTFPKIYGIILYYGIGLNRGDKTVQRTAIPDFIMKGDTNIKAAFLRQSFDDEGCVNNRNKTITFKSAHAKKSLTIFQIKKLLSDFGIESKIIFSERYVSRKGAKNLWLLFISGEHSLRKFYETVGFDMERKKSRLKNLLASYKQHHDRNWKNTLPNILAQIEEEKGWFDYKDVAERTQKSERRTTEYIRILKSRGIIRRINRRGYYKLVRN